MPENNSEETPLVTCSDCNCEFAEDDINGDGVCDSCEENYVSCEGCGERLHRDDALYGGDEYYCGDCYRERFTSCGRCGDSVGRDDTHTVQTEDGEEEWCQYCYENRTWCCEHCEQTHSNRSNRTHIEDADGFVCDSCRDDDFTQCAECADWYRDENVTHVRGRGSLCSSCQENDADDGDVPQQNESSGYVAPFQINNYSFKPPARFFGRRSEIMYGVELEVNDYGYGRPSWEKTLQLLGAEHAYLKEDGSIQSGGYEIVTQPHTLEEHRKVWTNFFADVPEGITSYKSGECGMHVHIERKKLTRLQIGKMLVFLNDPRNKPFVEKIAQRTANRFCRIEEKKLTSPTMIHDHDERYQALNVTNRHTVELRIFRGTLRADRFWKNMEFTDALVHWTRDVSYRELTAASFVAYVVANQRQYKYLYTFLIEIGYIDPLELVRKEILSQCA